MGGLLPDCSELQVVVWTSWEVVDSGWAAAVCFASASVTPFLVFCVNIFSCCLSCVEDGVLLAP